MIKKLSAYAIMRVMAGDLRPYRKELEPLLQSVLEGAIEAYERVDSKFSDKKDTPISIYADIATFLSCCIQIAEIIAKIVPDKKTRKVYTKLKQEANNARDYYQHIHDRAPKSMDKNEPVLGVLQLVEPVIDKYGRRSHKLKLLVIGSTTSTLRVPQPLTQGERWKTLYLELEGKRINITSINNANSAFNSSIESRCKN